MVDSIRPFLGAEVARQLDLLLPSHGNVAEIRLRVGKPMIVKPSNKKMPPIQGGYCPSPRDIAETMERISRHSFYAYEQELAMGYLTLPGGHRVGVAGQVAMEKGVVRAWRHIAGMNIRMAHSIIGCGDKVLPHIISPAGHVHHTMIISPPACGKTTLLRDIVRQISNRGTTVGLVDERSEVAGCYQGIPQNDVGTHTDVIDGCPKALAMVMLLRAMAPQVIAVDELGGAEDAAAVSTIVHAGVKLLCTAHGLDMADALANPALGDIMHRGVFQRFILLGEGNEVVGIYDAAGNCQTAK